MSDKGAAAGPDALPPDYDSRPSRFRVGSESAWKFGEGDVHEDVAERIAGEQAVPVLDLGCGEGRLMRLLIARSVEVVGLDQSPTMLKTARGKRVLGDARTLPFRAASLLRLQPLDLVVGGRQTRHISQRTIAPRYGRGLLREIGFGFPSLDLELQQCFEAQSIACH